MGQFQDQLPSQLHWIHELVNGELRPESEHVSENSFDPQQIVEESTIEFLAILKGTLTEYSRAFNGYSEGGTRFQDIKVYALAQSAADFMVFRSNVKLLISNIAHGVIQLSFIQHFRGNISVDGQVQKTGTVAQIPPPSTPAQSQELVAQIGPFRDVFWTFRGEKVTAEQVGKFYFIEFAKSTRDLRRSKAGNKVLLEQIKALLQDKGLEL